MTSSENHRFSDNLGRREADLLKFALFYRQSLEQSLRHSKYLKTNHNIVIILKSTTLEQAYTKKWTMSYIEFKFNNF